MGSSDNDSEMKVSTGDAGYILEDVPHLTDYIPDLPVLSLSHSTYLRVCDSVSWVLLLFIFVISF